MGYKYLNSFILLKETASKDRGVKDIYVSQLLEERPLKEKRAKSDSSYYPPEFYNKRLDVIKKFGAKCFLCEEEANEVHHIDYNTMNNDDSNLMCLCKSCHSKTNSGRKRWEKNLKQMMSDRFGFLYSREEDV